MKEREIILATFGKIGNAKGFLSEPHPQGNALKLPIPEVNEIIQAWRTHQGGWNHETCCRAMFDDVQDYYNWLWAKKPY